MESKPLVTVIVPAYNAGEFLEECLRSIETQTFREFEVVVVDDASTDNTSDIIDGFISHDSRFHRVSLPENKGLSGARNAGIEAAGGKYLCFVDADDCLRSQALEIMTATARENKADVCRTAFFRGQQFHDKKFEKFEVEVYSYREIMKVGLYQKKLINSAWGMIISTDMVRSAGGFREGIWYEDLDAFYRFYENAEKIAYVDAPLYFYRQNPGSFLARWSEARLDVLDVTDRLAEYCRQNYPNLLAAAEDRRFSAHYNILMLMRKHGVRNEEAMKRCRDVIREGRVRALKDPHVRIKNKIGALISYVIL